MNKPPVPAVEPSGSDISPEFLTAHLRDVFLLVFCLVGNRADAQELTQEAFITVLQRHRPQANSPWLGMTVRDAAIDSAIQFVRRAAVQSTEAASRQYPSWKKPESEVHDPRSDARWGERVVLLLHDVQSMPIERIARLLRCSVDAVRGVLARPRLSKASVGRLLAGIHSGTHPPSSLLALYVSRDLSRTRQLRLQVHARRCASCQAVIAELALATASNRQAVLDELEAIQAMIEWPALQREMTGNIAVGIDAARCIEHIQQKRQRFAWKVALMAAGLSLLFVAGWVTHIPPENSARLLQSIEGVFGGDLSQQGKTVAGSSPNAIFSGFTTDRRLALLHPPSAVVDVVHPAQISASFLDPETGQVMRDIVAAQFDEADRGKGNLRPAAIAVGFGSRFHVAIPERAPITLEDFDVSPKPRPPRDGLETSPLHIALRVRNATQKTIAAVAFRIQTHTRTGVLQAAFAVEGLNAFPNREIPVNADVQPVLSGGGSLELILDSVLFADLTSYGPDQAEALRLLTEDEAANRVERDYLSRLIANGQLDEVARELNAASVNPPPAANFELFEPAHPSVLPREVGTRTMHVPGVPLQIAAAGTAGGQLGVRLSNFSARTVSSVEVEVDGFDSTGDLVVAAHVPFIVRIPAGGTESIETGPGVGIRSQGPTGTVRSRVVFLRSVQFENGSWWTPEVHVGDAPSLGPAIQQTSTLVQILDRSPARLRLGALLRQSGMGAVEAELTRGNH